MYIYVTKHIYIYKGNIYETLIGRTKIQTQEEVERKFGKAKRREGGWNVGVAWGFDKED